MAAGADDAAGETTRDQRAVKDLLEFCEAAARLVARGRNDFEGDEVLRLAGEAIITRIGEAAGRLSPEFQAQHADIAWRAIRGMRNLVAHDYGRIDHVALWNTLERDLPHLAEELRLDVD